ncbi:MAG: PIN domain-containing protein [Candidatus Rokubacteria bacterium]|nr:PIN domain-containing protein [Candidatus Rokubacteria bacterium]
MKLLIDTSALLALAFRDDRNHEPAAAFVRAHPQARLVLTELILSEVATRVRARAGAERAVAIARSLLDSRRYELLFVDPDVVRGALDRMARFRDKRLSLVDCASFELMERLGLDSAFSFDADFRDCGYRMVP